MSVYTTLRVSREAALKKLQQLRGERQPTNRQLEDELEVFLTEKTFYNFIVTDDGDIDDATLENLAAE